MEHEIECGACGKKAYYQETNEYYRCDSCGARKIGRKWKLICSRCGKEAPKLLDLFVPHHCEACSIILHEKAKQENDRCLLCGKLRMDCYC